MNKTTPRPQRFKSVYLSECGTTMILGETYIVFIRMSDGLCERFSYEELGFK